MKEPTRVAQLDALLLDQEVLGHLEGHFTRALGLIVTPSLISRYQLELQCFLRALFYLNSTVVGLGTPGMLLRGLAYRGFPTPRRHARTATPSAFKAALPADVNGGRVGRRKQLAFLAIASTLLPWLWGRLRPIIQNEIWRSRSRDLWGRRLWSAAGNLDSVINVASLAQFLLFLKGGRYRSILERLLGIHLRRARHGPNGLSSKSGWAQGRGGASDRTRNPNEDGVISSSKHRFPLSSVTATGQRLDALGVGLDFVSQQLAWEEANRFLLFLAPIAAGCSSATSAILGNVARLGGSLVATAGGHFAAPYSGHMNAASEHVPGTRPKMALQIGEEDDASSLNASCGVCGALPIVMPYRATPCGGIVGQNNSGLWFSCRLWTKGTIIALLKVPERGMQDST